MKGWGFEKGIWERVSGSSDLDVGFGEPGEALSLLAVGPTFNEAFDFFFDDDDDDADDDPGLARAGD